MHNLRLYDFCVVVAILSDTYKFGFENLEYMGLEVCYANFLFECLTFKDTKIYNCKKHLPKLRM